MEFFDKVGALALGSRLKRLSDIYLAEVREIYLASQINFEPRWFPLFYLLHERQQITITEAAHLLGITHPQVSLFAKEMSLAKLLVFRKNPQDQRSRLIVLTEKGQQTVQQLQPLWTKIDSAVTGIFKEVEPDFLNLLKNMENSLSLLSLRERVQIAKSKPVAKIVDYNSKLRSAFENLNREWLEKYFSVEPIDRKYFADPQKHILDKGGDIFFASLNGQIVGTCSLLKEGRKLELAKMAVTESAQGNGIGELLAREAIRRAQHQGEKKLILVTNSTLLPAIALYTKLGFKKVSGGSQSPKYKRGDVVMEMSLKKK